METQAVKSTKEHRYVGKYVRYRRTKFTWPEFGVVSSATDESLWVKFYRENSFEHRNVVGERVGVGEVTFLDEEQLAHSHRVNNLFFLISMKLNEITSSEYFTTLDEFFIVLRGVIAYHLEAKHGSVREASISSGIPRKTLANWKLVLRKTEHFPK